MDLQISEVLLDHDANFHGGRGNKMLPQQGGGMQIKIAIAQ